MITMSVLGAWTSVVHGRKVLSKKEVEVVTNAIFVLFFHDIDSRTFALLKQLFPEWLEGTVTEKEKDSVCVAAAAA